MKDYRIHLWLAYLITLIILLVNLIIPLVRYYILSRKKQAKSFPARKC
jgi:heme exporter protein D